MQVSVTGKQLNVGEALRHHVETRLAEAVGKYFNHAIEGSVVLSWTGNGKQVRADISVHVGRGILMQGHGEGDDAHSAFETASDRVAKQLRRHKRRLRDHHRNAPANIHQEPKA